MAREQIHLPVHVGPLGSWADLSITAQWLTTTIARDHNTNTAGVAFYTTRRWANTASSLDVAQVEAAVEELEQAGRLVVDDEHGYVWLVDYMTDNRVFRQPNLVRGALKAMQIVSSPLIRDAVARQVAERVGDSAALVIGRRRKSISPALRLHVYERDDWTCQDCGLVIKPTTDSQRIGAEAPYDEVGWLELDHVHPHSHDGADTADNLRALCTPCNRIKGARILAGVIV